MIPLQNIIKQRRTRLPKNILLRGSLIKDAIKIHLKYFILEIEGNSMIDKFQASLGELVTQWSVSYVDFYLAVGLFVV